MAAVVFEDLSGTATPVSEGDNPYQPLIDAANDDPREIQAKYTAHRTTRNAMQKSKILDPSFSAWTIDPILAKLDGPNRDPTFEDPRHCIVFWGRPPLHIRNMIRDVQQELLNVAADLWLMPVQNLHITVLEVIFSVTEPDVNEIVSTLLKNEAAQKIANITLKHRPRLVKPMISFDAAALALSFVPAVGEGKSKDDDNENENENDSFTYHHLRREVYTQVSEAGVKPVSRYAVPSAHLTIGRFINQNGFTTETGFDHEKAKKFIEKIEEINVRLQKQFWPTEAGVPQGGEWILGQEKGLDFRKGQLWYGGGETVVLGQGH